MPKDELGLIRQVERDQLSWLNAILQEVLSVPTGLGVGLAPCVASCATPDGLFCRREAVDLGFEVVPEAGSVIRA
jgi:hypothetical protein